MRRLYSYSCLRAEPGRWGYLLYSLAQVWTSLPYFAAHGYILLPMRPSTIFHWLYHNLLLLSPHTPGHTQCMLCASHPCPQIASSTQIFIASDSHISLNLCQLVSLRGNLGPKILVKLLKIAGLLDRNLLMGLILEIHCHSHSKMICMMQWQWCDKFLLNFRLNVKRDTTFRKEMKYFQSQLDVCSDVLIV